MPSSCVQRARPGRIGCGWPRRPAGGPEGIVAALALAAPFYGAGLIGLLGVVGNRPGYCFAAALALFPISLISIAAFPLLISALALFGFATRTAPSGRQCDPPRGTGLHRSAATPVNGGDRARLKMHGRAQDVSGMGSPVHGAFRDSGVGPSLGAG